MEEMIMGIKHGIRYHMWQARSRQNLLFPVLLPFHQKKDTSSRFGHAGVEAAVAVYSKPLSLLCYTVLGLDSLVVAIPWAVFAVHPT